MILKIVDTYTNMNEREFEEIVLIALVIGMLIGGSMGSLITYVLR